MTKSAVSNSITKRVRWGRLEFGDFGRLFVRRERVDLGLSRSVRLLYASDLHLGHWWTARLCGQVLSVVAETRPDVVLLGGDLVDRRSALAELEAFITALAQKAIVAAVPGNHDVRADLAQVRLTAIRAGARWLPDGPLNTPTDIDGEVRANGGGCILCVHYPDVFPAAEAAGYRLVLAGHLHGGQCVLATCRGLLYPAVWLHRWHGLRFQKGASLMLVSRGAGDTFPLRFNCPREVILCDIR